MQNKIIYLYIFFSFFLNINTIRSQEISVEEIKLGADSLFEEKKYTDAKLLYEDLYFSKEFSSDDILIKLAFINEGLKKPEWTLFFLEKYLKEHPKDDKIKAQISNIATKNNLNGYEYDDLQRMIEWVTPYRVHIGVSIFIIYLALILFLLLKKQLKQQGIVTTILGVLLFITFIYVKEDKDKKYGVIIKESLLMDQPSAGGNLINTYVPGHKVEVLEEIDIWNKVSIEGQELYLLKEQLIII